MCSKVVSFGRCLHTERAALFSSCTQGTYVATKKHGVAGIYPIRIARNQDPCLDTSKGRIGRIHQDRDRDVRARVTT